MCSSIAFQQAVCDEGYSICVSKASWDCTSSCERLCFISVHSWGQIEGLKIHTPRHGLISSFTTESHTEHTVHSCNRRVWVLSSLFLIWLFMLDFIPWLCFNKEEIFTDAKQNLFLSVEFTPVLPSSYVCVLLCQTNLCGFVSLGWGIVIARWFSSICRWKWAVWEHHVLCFNSIFH